MNRQLHIFKSLTAFAAVLLTMPLGHALMIVMEHWLSPGALHCCAFALGLAGMLTVVAGVFVSGDTRQTLCGLVGGLLFWTGWVEFLFAYYAWRYGAHYDLVGDGAVSSTTLYSAGAAVARELTVNGMPVEAYPRAELKALTGSRPEYLIMPATFGMWMMFMMLYLFSARSGCRFMMWLQRRCGISRRVELRPMAHHASLVTFLELNLMLWSLYILLMFCYDPVFLGDSHPLTVAIAVGCLVGSAFIFRRQLHIAPWGRNIRMAIPAVLVFWTFVEITARNGMLKEIWVDPMNHIPEMLLFAAALVVVVAAAWLRRHRQ